MNVQCSAPKEILWKQLSAGLNSQSPKKKPGKMYGTVLEWYIYYVGEQQYNF